MEAINHEYYVSLEVAKLLKEAGFDWKIVSYYVRYYEGDGNDNSIPTEEFRLHINNNTYCTDYNNTPLTYINGILHKLSAPTLDVAQRWLREMHRIHVYVSGFNNYRAYREGFIGATYLTEVFDTYEKALEAGIKKALEIILEKGE